MRVLGFQSMLCAAAALGVGLIANCTGTMSGQVAGDDLETYEVAAGCDPDGGAPCWDDFFICTDDGAGNKRCEGQNPATPDDGAWECYEEGTTLVCRGDHVPGDTGFWECVEADGAVVCRAHAYVPSDGSDGAWNCWYEGEFRICEAGDGTDVPGGEEGGEEGGEAGGEEGGEAGGEEGGEGNPWDDWFPDGDDNGIPDAFEDMAEGIMDDFFDGFFDGEGGSEGGGETDTGDCECVAGAWRYCDTPTYCRWGVQYCEEGGLTWGACVETGIPAQCAAEAWYSPEAEACCIGAGLCCQDMWDADFDGDTWESLGTCTDIVCG
jgi:hypothetical protein